MLTFRKSVDPLAKQVRLAAMAAVLAVHVVVGPAQRHRAPADADVAIYRDVAPTRGWRAKRPALQHVLGAAASGAFDLLLVHQLDRLSRRMDHLNQIVEELAAASVAVRTVREPYDSTAPARRLTLRRWAAFERQSGMQRRWEQRLATRRHHPSTATAGPPTVARLELTAANPAPEVSMSRVMREIDRGTRTVDGVQVHITELV